MFPNSLKTWFSRSHEVIDPEAEEELLGKKDQHSKGSKGRVLRDSLCILTVINLVTLGVITFSVLFSGFDFTHEKNRELKQCNHWSPILEKIKIPNAIRMVNGTFFPPTERSIARQPPGPENDAAWKEVSWPQYFPITREDVVKLGKDPNTAARFDEEYWGFEPDTYVGMFDAVHQMHCLDAIRQAAFSTYPGYEPENKPQSEADWIHVGHCVDALRQYIQCSGNTDVITVSWVKDNPGTWADFNAMRKCHDYNTLLNYQKEHGVDRDRYVDMPRPKGDFVWPHPKDYPHEELGHKIIPFNSLKIPENFNNSKDNK